MHEPEAVSDKHEKKYRMTEYRWETRKELAVCSKSTRNNASNSPRKTWRILPCELPGGCDWFSTMNRKSWNMPMSALGQKQTSAHDRVMSALPPKADIDQSGRDVRFVPKANSSAPRQKSRYSITSSASASSLSGICRSNALAVLRLMTRSNLVGCKTGKSPGRSPPRMRAT